MSSYPYLAMTEQDQIVYVRQVDRSALPREMRRQTKGMEEVYSICDGDGMLLAFVDDREKAFRVARLHEKFPVSVH